MNQFIAGIYGTRGHEKTAAEGGEKIASLSDLSMLIAAEAGTDTGDLEKVAAVHDSILKDLISFDQSGRAMAHSEFSEMEAEAAAGDSTALEAFFADIGQQSKTAALKEAARRELARRAA